MAIIKRYRNGKEVSTTTTDSNPVPNIKPKKVNIQTTIKKQSNPKKIVRKKKGGCGCGK